MYTSTVYTVTSSFLFMNKVIYLIRCPDKGLKGIVLNRTCLSLNKMSLEITLTVPLKAPEKKRKPQTRLPSLYSLKNRIILQGGENLILSNEPDIKAKAVKKKQVG